MIIYQPIVAMSTVSSRSEIDTFNDFCVNCFMKKSERAVIDMRARGDMRETFSSPNPYLFIVMMNMMIVMASKQ